MKTLRIVGLSIVATGFIWFQVAGRFEAQRIDQQRESRPASPSQSKLDRQRAADECGDDARRSEVRGRGRPPGSRRGLIVDQYKALASGLRRLRHPFTARA
jgi:hypothetical protein